MNAPLKKNADVSVVLAFFALLAIFGVAGGGFVVNDYARARASAAWPAAPGVILSRIDEGDARIRYAYSFGGRNYESRRERVFTARFLKKPVRDYSPGDTVSVFVDPENHGFSVLEPGGAGAAFVFFSILSGLCVFLGVGGVVWALAQSAALDEALHEHGGAF